MDDTDFDFDTDTAPEISRLDDIAHDIPFMLGALLGAPDPLLD